MKRHFLWATVIAASALFGGVFSTYQPSRAGASATADNDDQDQTTDLADQLREIKSQVKEINTLLHSGTLRVVVVMNPPNANTPSSDDK
jgi:hypothetical protein